MAPAGPTVIPTEKCPVLRIRFKEIAGFTRSRRFAALAGSGYRADKLIEAVSPRFLWDTHVTVWPKTAPSVFGPRRSNLIRLLRELQNDGHEELSDWAFFLDLTERELKFALVAGEIPDSMARAVEWATHKPTGWLDVDNIGNPSA